MSGKKYVSFFCLMMFALAVLNCCSLRTGKAEQPARGVQRIVLVEMMTSVYCGPCYNAEQSIDQLQDEYGQQKMITLKYYTDHGHPFTFTDGYNRVPLYYDVSTRPALFFDGLNRTIGGSYNRYKSSIDYRYPIPAPITIAVSGKIRDSSAEITVTINRLDPVDQSDLYVRAVLFENGLYFNSMTHDYVTRDYTERSITLEDAPVTENLTIALNPSWNQEDLGLVVFVQDGSFHQGGVSDKTVLNSAVLMEWGSNLLPSLTIEAPAADAVLQGMTQIRWTATDADDPDPELIVDISYRADCEQWSELSYGEENDGTYDWNTTGYTDDDYHIRINVSDAWGGIAQNESQKFSIDNPDPPGITLIHPAPKDKLSGNVTITWDSSDQEDDRYELKISIYYTTDSINFTVIVKDVRDNGSHVWDTSSLEDGTNYRLKLTVRDTSGLVTEYLMKKSFTIDNMDSPLITLVSELEGKTISGEYKIEWTAEDDEDPYPDMLYSLYLSCDGGGTWTTVFEDMSYMTNYELDTLDYPNGEYLLKVVVTDSSGLAASDVSNGPFTIYNNNPPSITLTDPVSGGKYERFVNITYVASDPEDPLQDLMVSIHYSLDTKYWIPVIENSTASEHHLWNVSELENDDYFLRIEITDTRGEYVSVISGIFTISNNLPPAITSFFPAGGEIFQGEFTITWEAKDPDGDELTIKIEYQMCTNGTCTLFEELVSELENTGSYTVSSGTLKPGKYLFKIIATEAGDDPYCTEAMTTRNVTIEDSSPDGGEDDDDGCGKKDGDGGDDADADEGSGTIVSGLGVIGILLIVILVVGAVVMALVILVKRKTTRKRLSGQTDRSREEQQPQEADECPDQQPDSRYSDPYRVNPPGK